MHGKQLLLFALSCVIILVCSSSGCIFQENYLAIAYWAEYDQPIDLNAVEEIFTDNNISCELHEDVKALHFSFGKRQIDNETIEGGHGSVWGDTWTSLGKKYKSEMFIELDTSMFPHIKKGENKEKLYSYKPYLNKSMDYVTTLIYNATGLWPVMKEYKIEDDTK